MRSSSSRQRLPDILDNILAIEDFTRGLTLETYLADRKTIYAVTRALEIISEASRHISDDAKRLHGQVNWPALAAVGNVCRHEYEAVDDGFVWQTVQKHPSILKSVVEQELKRASE